MSTETTPLVHDIDTSLMDDEAGELNDSDIVK
jgi:hypothetical protein